MSHIRPNRNFVVFEANSGSDDDNKRELHILLNFQAIVFYYMFIFESSFYRWLDCGSDVRAKEEELYIYFH